VGYPHGKKGWKVYDLETGNIFVSHDVVFSEKCFPFVDHKDMNQEQSLHGIDARLSDNVFTDDFDGWESHRPHAPSTYQPSSRYDPRASGPTTVHEPCVVQQVVGDRDATEAEGDRITQRTRLKHNTQQARDNNGPGPERAI